MKRFVFIAAILACSAIFSARCSDAQTTTRPPLTPAQRAASDPRVYQAQQEVEKKNYAQAVELLAGFLKDYPNDPTAHFQLGYVYGLLQRSENSISEYRRAAELKPDFAEAYFSRGFAKKDKGDLDGAITDYTKAIELKPNYALAYNNRGWCELSICYI